MLCPRCGATVRKKLLRLRPGKTALYGVVTMLGNKHNCPRGHSVAKLIDQGKRPYAELEKISKGASEKRLEKLRKRGLLIEVRGNDGDRS